MKKRESGKIILASKIASLTDEEDEKKCFANIYGAIMNRKFKKYEEKKKILTKK